MLLNFLEPKLKNAGLDCWNHCSDQQGPCSWCGTEGMCCTIKHGWTDTSNGCDGSFGGATRHECAIKSGKFILSNPFLACTKKFALVGADK